MTELLETSMATRRNERLNDIYDILKYEDALRVTFVAFRLRGIAKDWWLRASEARTLKNQPWTWNDFEEEFKKEYILRLNCNGHWLPCHQWDSQLQLKPPRKQRWLIKRLYRGKQPLVQRDFKRSRGEQRTGNEGRPTLTPGGAHRVMFPVWKTRTYQGPVP
ncbi:hypothetical protein M9H77_22204 [Catharanthus roseus]|uniref:Uncharacterized protein n=1 Tax=Catharanthus roseus TaxID=4058 RepID=A0ACC0ATV1_CATRO|nr:hypothetical protein M9H77_22204 [Catharanthus roseus]